MQFESRAGGRRRPPVGAAAACTIAVGPAACAVEPLEGRRLLSAALASAATPKALATPVTLKRTTTPAKVAPTAVKSTATKPTATKSAIAKPKVFATGRTITPGVFYRPATDVSPTLVPKSPTRKTSRGGPVAHTNYVTVLPKGVLTPSAVGSTTPYGLTATQVRRAYGLDTLAFSGITGDGAGQTIAIIDAYDSPGFVSSTDPNYLNSDLHQFSVGMGLPDPPSFTKIDQNGGTNYPAANGGWANEIAGDVEWAHAMAPKANLVLVEASSANTFDVLQAAVNTARNYPGVSAISMSFGVDGGFSGQQYFDPNFTTPAGHAGVTFLAATGDHGAQLPASDGTTKQASFPADSANVVGVGGTTLNQDATGYLSESGWAGSGGGISNFEAKPAYQSAVTQSATKRTAPDVAILGDPNTGVAVYDSYNNTSGGGWDVGYFGGTSLSSPLWAGLVAVANQGRALNGLSSLSGTTQTLPRLYQLPTSVFHDVTTGNNGFAAGAGYDLVTGRGTPLATTLLPDLAGGNYTGTVFRDNNGNGVYDGSDTPIAGQSVFNDTNHNGVADAGEAASVTGASGVYALDLVGGLAYDVRAAVPAGSVATGATDVTGTSAYGTFAQNFGFFLTTISAPAGNNAYALRLDATGTRLQVFENAPTTGPATYQVARSLVSGLTINGNAGDDTLTVDLTNGAAAGTTVTFNAGGQVTADRVAVVAGSAAAAATFSNGTAVQVGTFSVADTGVEATAFAGGTGDDTLNVVGPAAPAFTGGGGNDTLNVAGGTFAPTADLGADGSKVSLAATGASTLAFLTTQHLAGLSVGGSSVLTLGGSGLLLRTGSLSVATASGAAIDLGKDAVILDYASASPLASVAALVVSGYAAGTWAGAGLRSSAADARRAVGFADASVALRLSGVATGTFFGESVDATTVLLRYTLKGDADLDGGVSIADFNALASHFGVPAGSVWSTGDFDYDAGVSIIDFNALAGNFGRTLDT